MALSCIVSHWLKVAKFIYPTCMQRPVWVTQVEFHKAVKCLETRVIRLPYAKESMICDAVSIQYRSATDERTELLYQFRASALLC